MKFTEYLKLKKPESEIDYVLIEDFNENSDSVDKKIKEVDQKVEENSSAIGQIANDRGYIKSKSLPTADLNTMTNNGKYFVHSGCTNTPISGMQGYLEVSSFDVGWVAQRLQSDTPEATVFVRERIGGVWHPWREIATSEIYTLIPLVGVSAAFDETPTLIKTGKICAIYGTVNLNSITPASSIFQRIPPQFVPKRGAEIFMKNLFPPTLLPETRLFVNVDGIISIHGFTGTLTSTSASFNGIWEVQ